MHDKLARTIDEAFEARDKIGPKTKGAVRKAFNDAQRLYAGGKFGQAADKYEVAYRILRSPVVFFNSPKIRSLGGWPTFR